MPAAAAEGLTGLLPAPFRTERKQALEKNE